MDEALPPGKRCRCAPACHVLCGTCRQNCEHWDLDPPLDTAFTADDAILLSILEELAPTSWLSASEEEDASAGAAFEGDGILVASRSADGSTRREAFWNPTTIAAILMAAANLRGGATNSLFPYPDQAAAARVCARAGVKARRVNMWVVRTRNACRRLGREDTGEAASSEAEARAPTVQEQQQQQQPQEREEKEEGPGGEGPGGRTLELSLVYADRSAAMDDARRKRRRRGGSPTMDQAAGAAAIETEVEMPVEAEGEAAVGVAVVMATGPSVEEGGGADGKREKTPQARWGRSSFWSPENKEEEEEDRRRCLCSQMWDLCAEAVLAPLPSPHGLSMSTSGNQGDQGGSFHVTVASADSKDSEEGKDIKREEWAMGTMPSTTSTTSRTSTTSALTLNDPPPFIPLRPPSASRQCPSGCRRARPGYFYFVVHKPTGCVSMREASVHHKERGGKSVYEYVTLMRSREKERERD